MLQNNNDATPISENAPFGGDDPYSASKACTELVVNAYAKSFSMEMVTIIVVPLWHVLGQEMIAAETIPRPAHTRLCESKKDGSI